jgi:hypothetical protein
MIPQLFDADRREVRIMIDAETQKPIRVSSGGTAGPYIKVPVDRLTRVRDLLDSNGVKYWVESAAISMGGKPAIAFINLGLTGDAGRVQAILDEAQ